MSTDAPVRPRTPPALRAAAVESRRSAAPLLLVAVAAIGTILLFVHPDAWVGRWMGLATYLRTNLILVVPLVGAVAAWQGGRERRRRLDDLLGTTSRPGWHALLATWVSLAVAATVGMLVTFAVGVAFVAPHATYSGGGWPWIALGCVPPVAAAAALGLAVGRWIPLRVAGLVLAVLLYLGLAVPGYAGDVGWAWLDPLLDGIFTTSRLLPGSSALQAVWFLGLTLVLLAVAGLRSAPLDLRAPALAGLVGASLAAAAAVPLVTGPGSDRWVDDPAARRQVCTTSGPQVCVDAVDAFLLDDLAPRTQAVLRRVSTIPGAPTRAVSGTGLVDAPRDALVLSDIRAGLDGGLLGETRNWGDPLRSAVESSLYAEPCPVSDDLADLAFTRFGLQGLATAWVLDDEGPLEVVDARLVELWRALSPDQQREVVRLVYADRGPCTPESLAPALAALNAP